MTCERDDPSRTRQPGGKGGRSLLSLAQWSRASLLSFSKSSGAKGGHAKKADEPARVVLCDDVVRDGVDAEWGLVVEAGRKGGGGECTRSGRLRLAL